MPAKKIKYQSQLTKRVIPETMIEMIGKAYGRLKVIKYAGYVLMPSGAANHYVLCECECGRKTLGAVGHLRHGKWKSCGCLRIDFPNRFVHGFAPLKGKREKIYHAWKGMHARTGERLFNDTTRKYAEKGIKVCKGWSGKEGFINFKNDMLPITDKSLDRINNDLHYSCGHCDECEINGWELNCRWGSDDIQSNNRGDFNNRVVIDGKSMTYTEASRYLGFPHKTLQSRIKGLGWSVEKAISTPMQNLKKK